ncbi:MAG: hypothetical protein UT63_C0004G0034 [Candidatus Gottesmanbacteria bacterium GW2011_GWC2_39_8]|uniref:Coenzyme F420:L-glutamate ligase-like domain-containing protein n=1 Tax=Candidatus Gottesmanbacteria bacterium GW2011_GWC2_39_8 TaxID=1618450 RepID=A0A0G0T8Q7_9BACT|nr:MAG: hypothetical protein UT63_C0004G0034 [Candidatus Gottesmanbacteria bacterium GW2011_GWC2_39_8]
MEILNKYVKEVKNKTVIAITSKIISICEGRVVEIGKADKDKLIREESELYLPPDKKYNFSLTIKNNVMIASSGIDESNGNGYYVLWPEDPQKSANKIREYLVKRFKVKSVGVIIVDSKTTPLRWGVTGVAIAHSGFEALNNYIGTPDIFGRLFKVEKVNVADGLAASAVLAMGEGREQTPVAIIEDVPFVHFQKRNPTKKELEELHIPMKDDLYYELLKNVKWKKGGK